MRGFESDEVVCLLGDLNARVGDVKVPDVIGDYGVAGINESGEQMLDMCVQFEMAVCNTFFKKRGIHKYTWIRKVRGEIVQSELMDYVYIWHLRNKRRECWM